MLFSSNRFKFKTRFVINLKMYFLLKPFMCYIMHSMSLKLNHGSYLLIILYFIINSFVRVKDNFKKNFQLYNK